MLMGLVFEPLAEQIVYHYCSAETLRRILESRRLRFTDINMLNDAYEMRCGYSAFEEAVTRIVKRVGIPSAIPAIPLAFFDEVDEIISRVQLIAHPFVACFSLDGDSLGQWRAYADDGRGFAIGFRTQLFAQIPVTPLRVEYNREKQIQEMMAALLALYWRKQDLGTEGDHTWLEDRVLTGAYMVGFKNAAFEHEKEIRCLHVVSVKFGEREPRFLDLGGHTSEGHEVEGETVRFQVRNNHLCAYLDLPFRSPGCENPVAEIVLGPKNHSYEGNVRLFLGGTGYSQVALRRSAVPYQ